MFGTIRKHSQALWIPIIIVIVISFVVYFTPGYDPFEDRGATQSGTDASLSFARQQVLLEEALNMSQRFNGFCHPKLLPRPSLHSFLIKILTVMETPTCPALIIRHICAYFA